MRLSAGTQGARLWARCRPAAAVAFAGRARRARGTERRARDRRTERGAGGPTPRSSGSVRAPTVPTRSCSPVRWSCTTATGPSSAVCPTSPRSPRGTSCSARCGDDPPGTSLIFMPDKGGWLQSADRPLVREGRMWDLNAPGELLVDEVVAHEYGISVGDQVPFTAFRKGQNASGSPEGASFELTVVGIVREPSQYLFPGAGVFLSPGTADRYGTGVELIGNSHVRLADPDRDMARLRQDVPGCSRRGRRSSTCTPSNAAWAPPSRSSGSRRCSSASPWRWPGSSSSDRRSPGPSPRSTTTPSCSAASASPGRTGPRRACSRTCSRRPSPCRSRSSAPWSSRRGSRSATPAPSIRTWASTSTGRSWHRASSCSRASSSAVRSPWRGGGAAGSTSTPRGRPTC